eukprot:TRINITY_DN276_c0_g1_i4.p2 TRINITY_DN276_c0_g1~~TRINITY_DN276_c0_g1_i4.p2  ORF type:complete len:131 (-),score=14.89 TRINITY_DN276_c0_g1_i4:77-469(-)
MAISGMATRRPAGTTPAGSVTTCRSLGMGRTARMVACGIYHTCAILDDHTLKCWGRNDNGVLGYGDTTYRGDDPGEMGDDLPTVDLGTGRTAMMVACGMYHNGTDGTCAILDAWSLVVYITPVQSSTTTP